MTRDSHLGPRIASISATTFSRGLRVPASGQAGCELVELTAGLGHREQVGVVRGRHLLGMAALGDGGMPVGRVDVGSEVGHVQHQARQVQPEGLDHGGDDPPLDLAQLHLADGVHGVPEAAVGGGGQLSRGLFQEGFRGV